MKDPMDMTDGEYRLYQARQCAARGYCAEGFPDFAERVERGEADECHLMRLARFFIEPTPPPSRDFIAAWEEFARAAAE